MSGGQWICMWLGGLFQVEFAAWGAVLAVYAKGVTAESVLIAMGASSCDATETTAGGCIEAV